MHTLSLSILRGQTNTPEHPANCQFEADDAEDDWMVNNPFDFVHKRGIIAASRNPREILVKAYNALKLGGYLETVELVFPNALPHNQVRYQTLALLDINMEYFMICADNFASLKMSLAQPPNVRSPQYHIATSNRILTIRCQGA
jgi:hypothetical protein